MQSFAPKYPSYSVECAEQKSGDGKLNESSQETGWTAGDRPRAGRRKCMKQSEGRKQNVENGA